MYIRSRDESIEQLAEEFRPELLRKVITQGYSALSLSVMADFKTEYAAKIAGSDLKPETINKLTRAYADGKISSDDLLHIAEYTDFTNKCDKYVDDFLDSIDNGIYHTTAAKILAAVNFSDCSYKEAVTYVKTGAFYPTDYAALSVTADIARELNDMVVQLRGCQGFNGGYNVEDIEWTIKNGDAILIEDKDLAVTVCKLMQKSDWTKFRSSFKDIADSDNLTGEALSNMYEEYVSEPYLTKLYNKVQKEYTDFISALKKQPPDVIIQSAYEVVWKDNITMYCEEYSPKLTETQFEALLSSRNTLDEVYEQWLKYGELNEIEDIGEVLAKTADKIQIALDREKELPPPKVEAVPDKKPPQTVKPKHKSR